MRRNFLVAEFALESEKSKIDVGFEHSITCICEGMHVVCNKKAAGVIRAVEATVCQEQVILEEIETDLWNNMQSHFLFRQ